jgi:hypothetical protein
VKWTKKHPPVLTKGESRFIWRFLFLPRRIGDETRWLEFVRIRQEVDSITYYCESGGGICLGWCDREFLPWADQEVHMSSTKSIDRATGQ